MLQSQESTLQPEETPQGKSLRGTGGKAARKRAPNMPVLRAVFSLPNRFTQLLVMAWDSS